MMHLKHIFWGQKKLLKRIYFSEQGRSTVEILGVLAVIGILTITALFGYLYALSKSQANAVLNGASIAYTGHVNSKMHLSEWTAIEVDTAGAAHLFVMNDEDGETYVRAIGIKKRVCERLLEMQAEKRLVFYNEKNELFTVCDEESSTMIFAYDGLRAIGKNCDVNEDCPPNGYCSTAKVCIICPENFAINADRNSCVFNCSGEKTTCGDITDADNRWCCPNTLICGSTVGNCVESDGTCRYELINPTGGLTKAQSECSQTIKVPTGGITSLKSQCVQEVSVPSGGINSLNAECILNVTVPQGGITSLKSDCAYTVNIPTGGINFLKAKCSATVGTDAEGNGVLTGMTGCGTGEYCYLQYTNESCGSNAPANRTGKIYGMCLPLDSNKNPGCPVAIQEASLTLEKGCNPGEYCYLQYSNNTCSTNAPANRTGTIYGMCVPLDSNENPGCPIEIAEATITTVQGCDTGQYCYLQYANNSCGTNAPANRTGNIYGMCLPLDSNENPGCPVEIQEASLSGDSGCGPDEYCYLQYANEACTTNAPANRTDTIYGMCLPLDSNKNPGCPIDMTESDVEAKLPCPAIQYCYLAWRNDMCQPAGANIKGTIYGICLEKDSNKADCFVPEH